MHAYGAHTVIEHIYGPTIDKLFDVQWSPEFTFHPPTMQVDPSIPFALKTGDQLHVRCEWNNTTSGDLTFGLEMCVGFVMFVNADNIDNMQCDKGKWGTF
jgi:hypothetical protein